MAKRPTRSEARDTATLSNPLSAPRDAASPTAIDSNRERPDEAANSAATRTNAGPNEDDIRQRAYQRYLERGGGDGQDFDDWLEAERELKGGKIEV